MNQKKINTSKLKSYENLLEKFNDSAKKIEDVIGNEKAIIHIHREEITTITKDLSTYSYLTDLGIKCYYRIEIEIEKDWFGIFTVLFIGICEVTLGVILKLSTRNDFRLIDEGFSDIE